MSRNPKDAGKGKELTEKENEERLQVERILESLERYKQDRQMKEKEWTDSYAAYMFWLDKSKNPFVANLSIPKVHEAVEAVSAFLLGPNQTITVRPEEGMFNWVKAKVAEKWLDFIWRKRLDGRTKLQTWVKQGVIFGDGILKVGYDSDADVPTLSNTAIEDVYFDFYESDIQASEYLIHVIRRTKADVMADTKYDAKDEEGALIREYVVESGEETGAGATVAFATYDRAPASQDEGKVVLHEVWCREKDELLTIAPTTVGWRVLRRKKNPYRWRSPDGSTEAYRPFVKLRFKVSPLPNRAYDMGGVYSTINIQKAFCDLFNQLFTNIALTNNAGWVRRKGASINARDLIRRPGQVVTVSDINLDLKPMETPSIKPEVLDMLNRLDNEFRQASMVSSLAQGLSETATEATMSQENFYTLLRPIQDNISDALSELGGMLLQISLDNAEGMKTLEMFESDNEIGILSFDPGVIMADYDTRIVPDRNAYLSKLYRQKQILEFITTMRGDPFIIQRYPSAPEKLYRMWLDEAGLASGETIFDPQDAMNAQMQAPPQAGPTGRAAPDQITNPESMMRSVNSPSLVAGELSKF